MPLQHLHLHVRDRPLSEQFQAAWFGMIVQRRGSEIGFMTDARKFLPTLMQDPSRAAPPDSFHFGFRLESAAELRADP